MIALPSAKPENGGELSIKYDKGKSTMVLSSSKRDALLGVSYLFFLKKKLFLIVVSPHGQYMEIEDIQKERLLMCFFFLKCSNYAIINSAMKQQNRLASMNALFVQMTFQVDY